MPPNMFSVGGGRPAPPCDVARCRTFVHLYSVIQNSMGLRGGELQTNVKNKSLVRATKSYLKADVIEAVTKPQSSGFR